MSLIRTVSVAIIAPGEPPRPVASQTDTSTDELALANSAKPKNINA